MDDKYKYMFLKYIYNQLDLNSLEIKVREKNIVAIDGEIEGLYSDISKYFSLVNNVNDSRLSSELREKYNYYFSLPIEKLTSNDMQEEVFKFLEDSYKYMLFPNISENFCYYGPLNYKYVAPRDSIVLGFNFNEFDLPEENFDELHAEKDDFICDMLNYIQDDARNRVGKNVAVLKYNEYFQKQLKKRI